MKKRIILLTQVKYEVAKYETEPVRKVTQVNPAASKTNDFTPEDPKIFWSLK